MSERNSTIAENFSIMRGGPLSRILQRLNHGAEERLRVVLSFFMGRPIAPQSACRSFASSPSTSASHRSSDSDSGESGIDRRRHIMDLEFLRANLVQESELSAFESAIEKTTRSKEVSSFPVPTTD